MKSRSGLGSELLLTPSERVDDRCGHPASFNALMMRERQAGATLTTQHLEFV